MTASRRFLFTVTVFASSGLLFLVEPMIARFALPTWGGSPNVWTTCMLFFQAALLAGYGYVHLTTRTMGVRGQAVLHLVVLAGSFWFLPFGSPAETGANFNTAGAWPTWVLLGWLTRAAGLPFFALACSAPMLQRWFAASENNEGRDPYFLYAASNAGSLLALVAYPLWVERTLRLGEQSNAWAIGLACVSVLVAACGAFAAKGGGIGEQPTGVGASRGGWATWAVLAMIPSSLMLGVTTYLTTDMAAVPLLWVVPLGAYLLSFVVAFGAGASRWVRLARIALPFLVMIQAAVMAVGLVQPVWVPLHVLTFFAAAVVCHGELARRRPEPSRLTAFYLAVAWGGALGGVFNALVAPSVFDRLAEYPLALVAACLVLAVRSGRATVQRGDLLLPVVVGVLASAWCADLGGVAETVIGAFAVTAAAGLSALAAVYHRARPARFALTVGAVLLASGFSEGVTGRVLVRTRNFFGVLRVTEADGGRVHRLFHGSTLHGQQGFEAGRRREPSTYFDRKGPMGQVFEAFDARPASRFARVVVTGMGAGSLACYAKPGQAWTFAEIDPDVVRVARDPQYFTYLSDCRADRLDVVLGDARLTMGRAEDAGFDMIVLDAFSSDAIPVHLLTREALALDLRKLAEGGLIVINITNRYLDLAPVVALLARDAGLACRVRYDPFADKVTGKQGSIWAVMARSEADLGPIAVDARWSAPKPLPGDRVWTDDFSSLVGHVRFGKRP